MNNTDQTSVLAASITRAASAQTYYTIRFLVDRDRVAEAYKAYGYFRWVDDSLDADTLSSAGRDDFIRRQSLLLAHGDRGQAPRGLTIQESMLLELLHRDPDPNSGLQIYLRNMMAVMAFDARRRGRWISQLELHTYTHLLASAVTEAMHHFIGHNSGSPRTENRYRAVTAAHITHMLRDTFDDLQAGYYNIPREVLEANHITPQDVHSAAYRAWVRSRVQLARNCFRVGRQYLREVKSPRCRLAGFAYAARFDWLLDTFEREGYRLRPQYEERKRPSTGLRMLTSAFASMIGVGTPLPRKKITAPQGLTR